MEADLRAERSKRLNDFRRLLLSGLGWSHPDDPQEKKFVEDLRSQELARSGLQQVASVLDSNVGRLFREASAPIDFFRYGKTFEDKFVRLCRRSNHNSARFPSGSRILLGGRIGTAQKTSRKSSNFVSGCCSVGASRNAKRRFRPDAVVAGRSRSLRNGGSL